MATPITDLLGEESEELLSFKPKVSKDLLHLPGPDFVSRVMADTDRPTTVLRTMQEVFNHGRLGGTRILPILPVDQGIEHSAGRPDPLYFDPAKASVDWPLRVAATPWLRRWVFWALALANTPTKSHSSSKSTTTDC